MAFNTDIASSRHSADITREIEQNEQPSPENYEKITLKIKTVIHTSKETGFFVFEGDVPKEIPPPRININGKRFIAQRYLVQGTSFSFTDENRKDQIVECLGSWIEHPQYGVQFHAVYVNEKLPASPIALKSYLEAGRIKHIGKTTANAIMNRWGEEAFKILDEDYMCLTEINGISEKKAKEIHEDWKSKNAMYEIVSYLGLYGLGESVALKVFEHFMDTGKDPIEQIELNPYVLTNVDGIGFKTADKLALALGLTHDDPKRLTAALLFELDEKVKKDGNMAVSLNDWLDSSSKDLDLSKKEIFKICQKLCNDGKIIVRKLSVTRFIKGNFGSPVQKVTTEEECVSPRWAAITELNIAKNFKRLIESQPEFDKKFLELITSEIYSERRHLDISQQKATWLALTSPFSVITGGPGTGKTTTLRSVVDIAGMLGWKIVLAAPTGKATKRMEQAIGRESMTIHRRLKYKPPTGFEYNQNNKMDGTLFVVDETSMVDASLMFSWISAIPDGARLLFVGDADQLPSVGAGDVLRDLIKSGVIPVSRLEFLHRTGQNSDIPINAQLINSGKPPSFSGNVWGDDYAFLEADSNDQIFDKMMEIIDGLLRNGEDPNNIQILCPQKNGPTGTDNLNYHLRWKLNKEVKKEDYDDELNPVPPFVNGDRVMQIKNDYEIELFNGDIGYITDMDNVDKSFIFCSEDLNEVSMDMKMAKNLQLAYAMTVHKSQGSEAPIIIIPVSKDHSFTLNRNLLYTGVTRGKKKVILIGDKKVVVQTVKKEMQQYRITGLIRELNRLCPQVNEKNVLPFPQNPIGLKRLEEAFNWDNEDDENFNEGYKN